jgi:cellulose synthase/poly-beta-1,6-N-acetylglucosamine synthase-like glycosyltransferase
MATFLLAIAVAPLIVLTAAFALEVVAGLKPLDDPEMLRRGRPSAVIVVPAHDEEQVVAGTLKTLVEAVEKSARILLVADNCTDTTAAIARAAGVDVIERFDADHRGKGHALDFARSHLRPSSPDVVVILDADCVIDKGSMNHLISACAAVEGPVQAIYLQTAALSATPVVQLSTFAFFVRNVLRQRGLQRLAGRVHLVGTGMAFPWFVFERLELATSNIVEDLQIGLELAEAGGAPRLIERATVWSSPATQKSTLEQRRRWEGGFLQTARAWLPRLLARSARHLDLRALWAALSLAVPPLALLMAVDLAALLLVGMVTWKFAASPWPVLVLAGSIFLAIVGCALAWASGGHRFVSLRSLIQAPFYIVWKLPLYASLARRGAPNVWTRTERNDS